MDEAANIEQCEVRVGGLSRDELMSLLDSSGVLLNAHAGILLQNAIFDQSKGQDVVIVQPTVGELGFPAGAVLSEIFAAAGERGLLPCPPETGPYLRLALSQATAPDSVMSAGRAPSGAVTVASLPLSEDDGYPKGFYLRVVDGRPWLRGYRCDDEHLWSPEDTFAFRLPTL